MMIDDLPSLLTITHELYSLEAVPNFTWVYDPPPLLERSEV